MVEELLLSTAYFPPASYFSLIARSTKVLIEREENYHKQTWRNRCLILGPNGPLPLVIPVQRGSFHKTAIRDLRIDNARRWRDLHLRGINSAYAAAPFFEFYIDVISGVISKPHTWLLDLNSEALDAVCGAIGLNIQAGYTDHFEPEGSMEKDYRYTITPKKEIRVPGIRDIPYTQVFGERYGFTPGLSIIDMILNNGPGTRALLLRSLEA
ncbi:hypothetical protein EG830_16165, partial [bacterium]|nr:hypothetical protein [bacterium]